MGLCEKGVLATDEAISSLTTKHYSKKTTEILPWGCHGIQTEIASPAYAGQVRNDRIGIKEGPPHQ